MKYPVTNVKKEMHTTRFQVMRLSQLAITYSTYLFAKLIAVDGISCDSRPSPCGDNKDASFRCLKNSAIDSQDFFMYNLSLN